MILTEKYRPRTLDDVVGQDNTITVLKKWIEEYKAGRFDFPHMLLSGSAGTGKTTVAKAFGREVLGEWYKSAFIDINASDERGVDTVRERIKGVARTKSLAGINIMFLDEADNLTKDAMFALRRIMEDYSQTCRFILSCNHAYKIIDPIRSRCAVFNFTPVTDDIVGSHIRKIAEKEGLKIEDEAVRRIVDGADGNIRDALNLLSQLSVFKPITEDVTIKLLGENVTKAEEIYALIKAKEIKKATDKLEHNYFSKNIKADKFMNDIFRIVQDDNISDELKAKIISRWADISYFITIGGNDLNQLKSFLYWLYLTMKRD